MCKILHEFKAYKCPKNIQTASRTYIQAKGIGTLKFKVKEYGLAFISEILNVEWTPEVQVHLLNPAQFFKDGFEVMLEKGGAIIKDSQKHIIIKVNE
jgi:hypothetical protein